MAVTSSTLAGVNVWQFSGVVTDAQIQTAWAALVVNGVYVINRAIYLDSTADLTAVTGGFMVDFGTQVLPAVILHTGRDKAKSTFNNFIFIQRTGLIVNQRSGFVATTNGTSLANAGSGLTIDGLSQNGGAFVYAVAGNPGGADPRYLNEMAWAGTEGVTIMSQEFTEQELQICVGASTSIKGMKYEKAYGFPQIGTPTGNVNVVVYRSTQNTQSLDAGGLIPIRLFPSGNRYAAICYVDSYVTRNGGDVTTRLVNAFGTNASNPACFVVLNNYTRESWFGANKTVIPVTTWSAANFVYGGVLKKLQFVNGGGAVVRCYDSRSTTVAQKCKFAEIGFFDFMDTNLAPTTDASGKISLVHIGAIASGATAAIARYTGQKYTFQKFGYRVIVGTPDMTSGDNDLSAFTPITLTPQTGLVRTQAAIQAATAITTFREVMEELHNLAITLSGISSYGAPYSGNFFDIEGKVLATSFSSVVIDPSAEQKIAYDAATNTLTIKTAEIASGTTITEWRNLTGTFTFENGAKITGVFADADGSRANIKNLDPEGFGVTWYLRYKKTAATTWTNVSGQGNSATILMDLDEYTIMARVPGYDWKTVDIDTNESLAIDMNLQYQVSANNTPQYTMSFDAALEASIQYDATKQAVSVTNTTGAITQPGFAELYQATQRIQHIAGLVWTWTDPVTANATSQKILIPTGNPISFFLTETSNATVKVTCPVIHLTSGQSADDRVKGNSAGYSIILGSPATAESAGLQSAIVSDILAKIGGTGFVVDTHSLVNLKTAVDALDNYDDTNLVAKVNDLGQPVQVNDIRLDGLAKEATLNLVKDKVDALENYNDTALVAKVDAIKGITDNLVNYNDTALVAKVDAIKSVVDSVKTTVENKTGYSLTTAQVEAIAVAVETHLLDEGDNKMLINAIVGAIDNANVDEVALVAAIRADIERTGGKLALLGTPVQSTDNRLDGLAKEATLNLVKDKVDALENYNDTVLVGKVETIGAPLQAVDYVAPANSDIGVIKDKVKDLENANLQPVIDAIAEVPVKVWDEL